MKSAGYLGPEIAKRGSNFNATVRLIKYAEVDDFTAIHQSLFLNCYFLRINCFLVKCASLTESVIKKRSDVCAIERKPYAKYYHFLLLFFFFKSMLGSWWKVRETWKISNIPNPKEFDSFVAGNVEDLVEHT